MMDEVEDANDDINIHMLAFVGSDGKISLYGNLTLTLLGCYQIFSQLFVMVKFH